MRGLCSGILLAADAPLPCSPKRMVARPRKHTDSQRTQAAQIIFAGDGAVQTGEFAVAASLVRLAQISAEAGIIDVLSDCGRHLQHDEAGRGVARSAPTAIVGGTDHAGEAKVKGGANEPAEAALDIAILGQGQGAWRKAVVREPAAGVLGKGVVQGSRWRWLSTSAWATKASRVQDVSGASESARRSPPMMPAKWLI